MRSSNHTRKALALAEQGQDARVNTSHSDLRPLQITLNNPFLERFWREVLSKVKPYARTSDKQLVTLFQRNLDDLVALQRYRAKKKKPIQQDRTLYENRWTVEIVARKHPYTWPCRVPCPRSPYQLGPCVKINLAAQHCDLITTPHQALQKILTAIKKRSRAVSQHIEISQDTGFIWESPNMSSSSGTPESWISSFCSLLGHEYFAEISEDFIEDDFNLTGLQTQVAMYKEALEMILDVEPEEDEDEEEEEEEDEGDESIEGEERANRRAAADRRHHRMTSDLSIIESSAEMLYGLIHQRFICSRAGIQQMSEKYELTHFGVCPRTNCEGTRTLPVGLSDVPGEDTVKLFCPSCLDVYVPPNSRFQTVDGAFFGRTFGALFLLTFPDYDISKKGLSTLAGVHGPRPTIPIVEGDEKEKINGMNACNLGPGLGKGKMYEPKIFGFKVSERARNGPRMAWLRNRPDDIRDLDEAAIFNTEHPDESEDESMSINGGPSQPLEAAQRVRRANGGSPMSIEPNGAL